MELGLDGKVAIVTGGSYGIGKAAAWRMAKEGAEVVSCARRQDVLDQAATEIRTETEGEVLTVSADVSVASDVTRVVDATLARFGRIDILVNNAGIVSPSSLLEMTESQWYRTIAVHLKGTFNCTQAVAKHMKERGGG